MTITENAEARERRPAEAVVVSEPAPNGARIHLAFKSFPEHLEMDSGSVPFHGDLSNWEYFGGAILSIGIRSDEYQAIVGSAVLVSPGIAIAARHVFEEHLLNLASGKLNCFAFGISSEGGILWNVKHINLDATDVVILILSPASQVQTTIVSAAVAPLPPAIGEKVMLVGFRAAEVAGDDMSLLAKGDLLISVGHVAEVFSTGRDRVMLPHPCAEVRCRSIGGMSGGAAFDSSGNLFGILTSSFDDHEGPSYVSLLHAALDRPIEKLEIDFGFQMPLTLRDLSTRKVLAIAGDPEQLEGVGRHAT